MTFSTYFSPGVALQGGGGSGGGGAASLPISGNGATITASTPLVNGTQTWNNAAVTFTGMQLNITDTASNAASLLMDLQVGGASRVNVAKGGSLALAGDMTVGSATGGNSFVLLDTTGVRVSALRGLGFASGNSAGNTLDLLLTRRGAANLRLGAADAATAVPQILSVQSVVATGANQAGADFTITGSQGRGSGAGGSIIFQVAPAGTSGSGLQNALVNALTIASNGAATFSGSVTTSGVAIGANISIPTAGVVTWSGRCELLSPADKVVRIRDNAGTGPAALQSGQFTVANLPAAATYTGSMAFVSDATATTARSTVAGGGANRVMVMSDGTNWLIVA